MKRKIGSLIIVVLFYLVLIVAVPWPGLTVAISGDSFGAGEHQVIVEYCYSVYTDKLLYAVIRTWPKDATMAEKMNDPRVGKTYLEWTTVRDDWGRMVPVSTRGDVYFFDGDRLKKLRVHMTESEDTAQLGLAKSLDEVWAFLQPFRTDQDAERGPW